MNYPDEAVGIWVGNWTFLVRRYTHAVQGERFLSLAAAQKALLEPVSDETWVPIRACY